MKPIDEKDKPKLFAMIGLCVVVLGYGAYSFMGANTPPNTAAGAATPKTDTATAKNGTPGAASAAGTVGQTPFEVALDGPPLAGRDPFRPSGIAAPKAPITVPGAVVNNASLPGPKPSTGGLDKLLDNAAKALGGNQNLMSQRTPVGNVVVMPPAPPPALTVTGVVMGDPTAEEPQNVAIVRKGGAKGDERNFVTVGDPVGNGYRVVAVHPDGVDIEEKAGRRLTYRIGKSGEDSRATN